MSPDKAIPFRGLFQPISVSVVSRIRWYYSVWLHIRLESSNKIKPAEESINWILLVTFPFRGWAVLLPQKAKNRVTYGVDT